MVLKEKSDSGQAVLEYILMLSIVAFFFLIVANGINKMGVNQKVMAPITGPFSAAYRYGNTKAKGFDDNGGPINHPRVIGGQGNFRIFITPHVF